MEFLPIIKGLSWFAIAGSIACLVYHEIKSKRVSEKIANGGEIELKDCDIMINMINSAIWAVGSVIDIFTDILPWINGKLEYLLCNGVEEVNVIDGDAFVGFIKQNQAAYIEISLEQLNAMENSVINVAMNNMSGNVVDSQMIRSQDGLSDATKAIFKGQPTLKIKIVDIN